MGVSIKEQWEQQVEQGRGKLNAVLERSATDMEFRQTLLSNPRAALSEFGQTIPDNFNLKFLENEADATVVLPNPVRASDELSENELEAVAGGSPVIIIASSEPCAILASAAVSYITAKI